jgi:hypothetical protein
MEARIAAHDQAALVDLHLESSPCMPGIEAGDVECATAQLIHEPWCHRTGFNPDASVVSSMSPQHPCDLLRVWLH